MFIIRGGILCKQIANDDIQIVTITRPIAYDECKPYHFVHS